MPGKAERLTESEYKQLPTSWALDGTRLAFLQESPGDCDIRILSLEDSGSTEPFPQTKFREEYPEISPDGRWLAYVSNETGKQQVYVQPFQEPGSRVTISIDGGRAPAWAGNSRELFYQVREGGKYKMMAVEIRIRGGRLIAGIPVLLFQGPYTSAGPVRGYDVKPDGQRFLMIRFDETAGAIREEEYFGGRLTVVHNWFEELTRLVPTN